LCRDLLQLRLHVHRFAGWSFVLFASSTLYICSFVFFLLKRHRRRCGDLQVNWL
jgi:hypothetical protein